MDLNLNAHHTNSNELAYGNSWQNQNNFNINTNMNPINMNVHTNTNANNLNSGGIMNLGYVGNNNNFFSNNSNTNNNNNNAYTFDLGIGNSFNSQQQGNPKKGNDFDLI
jgi:hypothetical protein